MIYGDLGRFPIEIDMKIKIVSFWVSIFLEKETQLSYLSYKHLYTLSIEENVHLVWMKYLKELFGETGNSSIWINQDIPNYNWLISSIKLRLHDQINQNWYSLIENTQKALNYKIFKEDFDFENVI